jgi:DNA-binding response OmpR family regulator
MARILLVDDEPSIRLYYQAVLADLGHDVVETASGIEAVRYVQNEPFDLVLLDIKLGYQNGLDVLREIVSRKPRLPVILLTAYGSFQDDYTSWKAHGYVLKSSDPSELFIAVDGALKRSRHPAVPAQRHFYSVL